MSLIPHCIPFTVGFSIFLSSPFLLPPTSSLFPSSQREREGDKPSITERIHFFSRGAVYSRIRSSLRGSVLLHVYGKEKKEEKSYGKSLLGSFNPRYSNFPGVHAVTYRDAVRSWEYLQLVGPSVRWVKQVELKRIMESFFHL